MSKHKTIVFIPPNGKMFINDFSIQRLSEYFKNDSLVQTILLKIEDEKSPLVYESIDAIINVPNEEALFEKLVTLDYTVIFHRSWMLAYPFAAKLVKTFDNVVVNIKDWNFSTKKEYEIIFGKQAVEDFEAIAYIFQNAKAILSHYTQKQAKLWAKKYHVAESKFIFFPEYCNPDNFHFREKIEYCNPKIAFAGSLGPTSYPEECFLAKSHLRALRILTKNHIDVSYVLTQGAYAGTQSPRQRLLFQDILYEDYFNTNFHLVKGETLQSDILDPYHFGFFILEYSTKSKHLNRYAVPSKFAFYLEAGLPMLINANMKALAYYAKKYHLGIVFENSDIENLTNIIDISQERYHQMVENVILFRETIYQYHYHTIDTVLFDL